MRMVSSHQGYREIQDALWHVLRHLTPPGAACAIAIILAILLILAILIQTAWRGTGPVPTVIPIL